jgi:hypothetical protein
VVGVVGVVVVVVSVVCPVSVLSHTITKFPATTVTVRTYAV